MQKKYSNDEIMVVWKPGLCIHSENCAKGLPAVFNPNQRPWVNMSAGTSQQIIDQVKQCPSGALSILKMEEESQNESDKAILQVFADGPMRVQGPCVVQLADGSEEASKRDIFLCRCGHSTKKPYCDGSHKRKGFTG